MKMKKILIFGTGFIANNLIQYFNNKYDDMKFIVLYNNHKINESNNVTQYSMTDDTSSILKKENPKYIIILHGDSFVSDNTSIAEATNHNVLNASSFLENIYNIRDNLKVEKIIVVGSASEYGKFYNQPIKEDFELHPTSVYGLSKIFLFNVAKYFIERGLPIVYIRQFNTVGMGQREDFVFSSFSKNIVLIEKSIKDPILNVGDLSQERDFLDIRDTCRAYEILLTKGIIGEVYNVASGEYISIEFLLNEIMRQSKISQKVKINENKNLFSKEASLSTRLHASTGKLKSLGFKRKYRIEDTIKDTLNYWRKNV